MTKIITTREEHEMQTIDFSDVRTYEFLNWNNEIEKAKKLNELMIEAEKAKQKVLFNNMVKAIKAEMRKAMKKTIKVSEGEINYECSKKGTPFKIWENLELLYKTKGIHLEYNELKKEIRSNVKWYVYRDFMTMMNSDCVRTGLNLNSNQLWDFTSFIANQNAYNPVEQYLKRAHEKYKNTPGANELDRLIKTITFAEHYTLEDIKFNEKIIKMWIMTGVKMGLNKGHFNAEFTLVFKGKQGLGKTRWFRALMPREFLFEFFKDGVQLDLSKKDDIIQATSYWLCELGELGGTMRKSDRDALKAWLTSTQDEYRTPYDRKAEKYPRRTFFACTVNDDEFLRDDTGNRRFIVIDVAALNHTHDIDVDLLWGQIMDMYLNGGVTYLDQSEIQINDERNRGYLVKSDEQLIIEDIIPLNQPEEKWGYITSTALCNYLDEKHGKKLLPKKVGKALGTMGFEQYHIRINKEKNKSRYYKMPFIEGYSVPF